MKIKRFTAANMQTGLKTISETLGPEAVILSNRRLGNGLEIVAGVDEQEYQLYVDSRPPQESSSDIIKANPAELPDSLDKETMQQLFAAMSDKNKKAFPQQTKSAGQSPVGNIPLDGHRNSQTFETDYIKPQPQKPVSTQGVTKTPMIDDQSMKILRQEIDGLKDLLREQTEQLKEPAPVISPLYERLESRLSTLGFTGSLSKKLLASYDRDESIDHNWRKIMNRFASALSVPLYEPLANGGVFALTGPTGAGKTTTLAKLAAHAVKDFGVDSVAIVSLDWFQVGGQEILKSVSNILGTDFYPLTEKGSLSKTLNALSKKRLVLIDTSGSTEAMEHWSATMKQSSMANRVQNILVLPATMQPSAINQFINSNRSLKFASAILSKLDESTFFGGVLEPVLKQRLPIWYCTTGQNIPKDIELADAKHITHRLIKALSGDSATLAVAS